MKTNDFKMELKTKIGLAKSDSFKGLYVKSSA